MGQSSHPKPHQARCASLSRPRSHLDGGGAVIQHAPPVGFGQRVQVAHHSQIAIRRHLHASRESVSACELRLKGLEKESRPKAEAIWILKSLKA